jgi:hypothetical protein
MVGDESTHRTETCRAAGMSPDYGKGNHKIKLCCAISARLEVLGGGSE